MEVLRPRFASTTIPLLLVCAFALAQNTSLPLLTAGERWAISGGHRSGLRTTIATTSLISLHKGITPYFMAPE